MKGEFAGPYRLFSCDVLQDGTESTNVFYVGNYPNNPLNSTNSFNAFKNFSYAIVNGLLKCKNSNVTTVNLYTSASKVWCRRITRTTNNKFIADNEDQNYDYDR